MCFSYICVCRCFKKVAGFATGITKIESSSSEYLSSERHMFNITQNTCNYNLVYGITKQPWGLMQSEFC